MISAAQLTVLAPISATQFWRNKVLEVAKDFPEYTFAVADEEDFATEVKDLGLSESGEDVNAAILDEGGRKFAMEPDDFDSDTLREFVRAFKKGEPWPRPLGPLVLVPHTQPRGGGGDHPVLQPHLPHSLILLSLALGFLSYI